MLQWKSECQIQIVQVLSSKHFVIFPKINLMFMTKKTVWMSVKKIVQRENEVKG